jgi:hypothetical protein
MVGRFGQIFSRLAYGVALLLFAGALYFWILHVPFLANVGAALFLSGILAGLIGRVLGASFFPACDREGSNRSARSGAIDETRITGRDPPAWRWWLRDRSRSRL